MFWISVVAVLVGLIGFLAYWFWPWKTIHALAVVGRVEAIEEDGQEKYTARARLFDRRLNASDEWWSLGTFVSQGEAVEAIRRFHGDRVTENNWYAFFKDAQTEVLPLGSSFGTTSS